MQLGKTPKHVLKTVCVFSFYFSYLADTEEMIDFNMLIINRTFTVAYQHSYSTLWWNKEGIGILCKCHDDQWDIWSIAIAPSGLWSKYITLIPSTPDIHIICHYFFNILDLIYTRTQKSQMIFYLYPEPLKLVATRCGCVKLNAALI